MKQLVYIVIFTLFSFTNPIGQKETKSIEWANAILDKMSLDEMIGQLFMIRAHSDLGADHIASVKRQIKKYHVGGMCFFQGTPQKQAELINEYQKLSKNPLLIAQDAEWGLGMRFKDKYAISFPKQLTLGAIKNNDLIYQMGQEVAKHLLRIGVQVNFAPVVDVNVNPANPVIHNRSFGEDIYNVTAKSHAYMMGMQDGGLMACAKHFPGHGDTSVDSHYDLPVILHDNSRLDSIELMPFRTLSNLGVKSMMSAHLQVPTIDNRENRPTSLSAKALQKLLIEDIGFKGLIFTDGLEMKGVANHFKPGEMEIEALKAGNDVLLLPIDIDVAFKKIKEAVKAGSLDSTMIRKKALKILSNKYELGLDKKPTVNNLSNIPKDINTNEAIALKSKLYEEAITLVKNEKQTIPIEKKSNAKIAVLSLGSKTETPFQKRINSYENITKLNLPKSFTNAEKNTINNKISGHDVVIIGLHDMNIYASKNYGITENEIKFIQELSKTKKVVLVNFGTPYALKYFGDITTIIQAYEEDTICQDITAQMIFGAYGFRGTLPVSVNDFVRNTGIQTASLQTLKYGVPEKVGMISDSLDAIKDIVEEMIKEKAAPGCQVLAIKDGQIVYDEAFGYHTYDKKKKVEKEDVYDVASVTKILATTISMMKMDEQKTIDINEKIEKYLPEIDTCNKGSLIIKDVLAHHAKLPGWIAFYENTLKEKESKKAKVEIDNKYYKSSFSDSFCLHVVDDLYLRCDYRDSIYQRIYACGLRDEAEYKYSDLGFYLFDQMITRMSGMRLDEYTKTHFYKPLGLNKTGFNPLEWSNKNAIVPSEKDDYYRNKIIHGHVHDMGAAMLGGVAGHAGLFSNTQDLAVIMQMLLNGGNYGGKQYLQPETIMKYTNRYYNSRRGLGFDMKETDENRTLNMSDEASDSTFGHLGFTGTAVFADPEHNLVYIFLSNRTFPTMNNNKFSRNEYRPRIQSVFYNALKSE